MIRDYLIILLISLVSSFLLTPVIKRIAPGLGAIDQPGDELKIHKRPIPRIGGVAILVGSLLAFGYCLFFTEILEPEERYKMIGLLLGGGLVAILGVIDDIKDLPPRVRFIGQFMAGLVVVGFGLRWGFGSVWYLSIPVAVFYLMGGCNAMNLLDGLDGLAVGVSALAAAFFLFLSFSTSQMLPLVISLGILGASLGFLRYNFYPAQLFMGDVGSTYLGFMLAAVALVFTQEPFDIVWLIIPIFILGVPIFDTSLALIRRAINRKPLFLGDRSHFYDLLMDRTGDQRKSVFIVYSLGLLFGLLGLIFSRLNPVSVVIISVGAVIGIIIFVTRLQLVRKKG